MFCGFSKVVLFQEKIPQALAGTSELIPMLVLKGKHFAEKFATENPQAFWFQDEKDIVSKPLPMLLLDSRSFCVIGLMDFKLLVWISSSSDGISIPSPSLFLSAFVPFLDNTVLVVFNNLVQLRIPACLWFHPLAALNAYGHIPTGAPAVSRRPHLR